MNPLKQPPISNGMGVSLAENNNAGVGIDISNPQDVDMMDAPIENDHAHSNENSQQQLEPVVNSFDNSTIPEQETYPSQNRPSSERDSLSSESDVGSLPEDVEIPQKGLKRSLSEDFEDGRISPEGAKRISLKDDIISDNVNISPEGNDIDMIEGVSNDNLSTTNPTESNVDMIDAPIENDHAQSDENSQQQLEPAVNSFDNSTIPEQETCPFQNGLSSERDSISSESDSESLPDVEISLKGLERTLTEDSEDGRISPEGNAIDMIEGVSNDNVSTTNPTESNGQQSESLDTSFCESPMLKQEIYPPQNFLMPEANGILPAGDERISAVGNNIIPPEDDGIDAIENFSNNAADSTNVVASVLALCEELMPKQKIYPPQNFLPSERNGISPETNGVSEETVASSEEEEDGISPRNSLMTEGHRLSPGGSIASEKDTTAFEEERMALERNNRISQEGYERPRPEEGSISSEETIASSEEEEDGISSEGAKVSRFLANNPTREGAIPPAVIMSITRSCGFEMKDPDFINMVSLAGERLLSSLANDALHYFHFSDATKKPPQAVLKKEHLVNAMKDNGFNVEKLPYLVKK